MRSFLLSVIITLLFTTQNKAQTQVSDTTRVVRLDSVQRPYSMQYIGVSSTLGTNQRSVGLSREFAERYGDMPLASIGISAIIVGDLLFKLNNLRIQANIEKYVNTYPSSKLLENIRADFSLGYYLWEYQNIRTFPFLGAGSQMFFLDAGIRKLAMTVEGGIGVDYFIPSSPLLVGFQASYNHTFNVFNVPGVVSNQPGFNMRVHLSFFLAKRYTFTVWE